MLIACGLALGGCPFGEQKPPAPVKKPPAPDYQLAATMPAPAAAQIRAICFNEADLGVFRSRMLIQELQVGTLQCQGAGGARLFERQYTDFLNKFSADMRSNGDQLKTMLGRKRRNVDVTVTEIANRTAQRASTDPEFCARNLRAFEWALSPQVTSLSQVPAPFDVGPEMNVHPCPPP
ncbi:MAG TPA: hypothetical protein VEC14_01865 [Reyranellaceae bacterium]|nr:hypothetical protein [Reyranellaceae bacterium]